MLSDKCWELRLDLDKHQHHSTGVKKIVVQKFMHDVMHYGRPPFDYDQRELQALFCAAGIAVEWQTVKAFEQLKRVAEKVQARHDIPNGPIPTDEDLSLKFDFSDEI